MGANRLLRIQARLVDVIQCPQILLPPVVGSIAAVAEMKGIETCDRTFKRKLSLNSVTTHRCALFSPGLRFFDKSAQRLADISGRRRSNNISRIPDDFARIANIGGDCRNAARHGFCDDIRKTFPEYGCRYQIIRSRIDRRHVAAGAKAHDVRWNLQGFRAASNSCKSNLGHGSGNLHEGCMILHFVDAADVNDKYGPVGNVEFGTDTHAQAGLGPELRSIDTIWNDNEFWRRVADLQVVALARERVGDNPVSKSRQPGARGNTQAQASTVTGSRYVRTTNAPIETGLTPTTRQVECSH